MYQIDTIGLLGSNLLKSSDNETKTHKPGPGIVVPAVVGWKMVGHFMGLLLN